MRLKLKYLRHPLRTANIARNLAAERWRLWKLARRGHRRFAGDPRYDLHRVAEGFASRIDHQSEDTALLDRICTAYIKAIQQESSAPEAYRATVWWERQRGWSLQPIIHALSNRDLATVRSMYSNFYRDRSAAGLIVPQTLPRRYFGSKINTFHRRLYLIDALYRIDHWKAVTGGLFTPAELCGPAIGNPFGVVIDGTLVRVGAEYQHYCAHRIIDLLASKPATVAEIGGGFGGMAYYLLRDRSHTTYIDFDVPESIALTSYYLLKAFPQLRFLLYGEENLTLDALSRADVVLMPAFELASMPAACADLTFSSHAMSDLSPSAMNEYLSRVAAMTAGYFLHIGRQASDQTISELVDKEHTTLKLAESRSSGWHDHRATRGSEVESLYRVQRADHAGPSINARQ